MAIIFAPTSSGAAMKNRVLTGAGVGQRADQVAVIDKTQLRSTWPPLAHPATP
jgi:hypothetical protein